MRAKHTPQSRPALADGCTQPADRPGRHSSAVPARRSAPMSTTHVRNPASAGSRARRGCAHSSARSALLRAAPVRSCVRRRMSASETHACTQPLDYCDKFSGA